MFYKESNKKLSNDTAPMKNSLALLLLYSGCFQYSEDEKKSRFKLEPFACFQPLNK